VNPLFVIDEVSVRFGGLQALERVSISMEKGERRVILGSNGAGKTTLFNIVSGLIAPTAGRILLAGQDITALRPHQRAARGLARTFQITTLFTHLTVLENIQIAVQALDRAAFTMHRPASSFPHIAERARELMEAWGLWQKRSLAARTLSYGEQRQVEMVMALAHRPQILLLDEPAAGLSATEKQRMISLIRQLDDDISVLLIEHHMDVAFALAEKVTVLHQGRMVTDGTTESVRNDPRVRQIYLGAATAAISPVPEGAPT
jgi:branched-chain amino acid transport system ATP-binding protein